MRLASLFFIPLFALALVTGCGAVRGGKTVVKYEEGQSPIVTEANASGTYALFSFTDFNPKVKVTVNEGDQIGFKSSGTGQVVAVAGNQEIPLNSNESYYWKRQ